MSARQATRLVVVGDSSPVRTSIEQLASDYPIVSLDDALSQSPAPTVGLLMLQPRQSPEACETLCQRLGPSTPVLAVVSSNDSATQVLAAGAADALVLSESASTMIPARIAVLARWAEREHQARQQADACQAEESAYIDRLQTSLSALRAPLAAVVRLLEALEWQCPAELSRDVAVAQEAAAKLRDRLEDVLMAGLLEASQLPVRVEPVSLLLLARRAVSQVVRPSASTDVAIRLSGSSDAEVLADAPMLSRAVRCLVTHCMAHAPSGSQVEVRVRTERAYGLIEIADRGPSIAAGSRRLVFERHGGVEAKRRGWRRGYGLELHLVDLIASAHGGWVAAHECEPQGALFELAVPLRRSQSATTSARAS